MNAVGGQKDQDDEVGNQQRQVKGVGLVDALKGPVEKMGAEVLPDAARAEEKRKTGKRNQGRTPKRGVETLSN
jgi:hypothetical protein